MAFARVRFAIGKQNPVSFNSVSSRKEQRMSKVFGSYFRIFALFFPSIFSIDFAVYY